ncbi:MerR family transcriptional regulator [Vagococcus fluvialis]|uniref:MerR family transcriptional regulator n=1 Tax=Vagococcus fluvialis TaxID=2738 RepID=UPI001A8F5F35|nr:MerR family DNA-binding transcriptional regulator [Vagococcus fluvialis]MBO0436302.1 MerR family transcriptional regulator [Vagococcus fluvialis]
MEDSSYSIGEISKLFNIPTSTIRYWEEKEVFLPRRNEENDYRLFNLQSTIELLDIVFYRNLNVPLKKMKHFNRLNPEAIYSILEDTEEDVLKELVILEKKLKGIAERKEQLESLFTLKERGYKEEATHVEKIVTVDMNDEEDIKIQLEYLSNFTLYQDNQESDSYQIGISVPKNYQNHKEILWLKDPEKQPIYMTCLLESASENLNDSNIDEHKKELAKKGYQVVRVIATYLATASEDDTNSVDYYKAWLEVVPIKN